MIYAEIVQSGCVLFDVSFIVYVCFVTFTITWFLYVVRRLEDGFNLGKVAYK